MKNTMKDLTEGMQRLCAVANRIVAQNGKVSRIETDLLMEDLRHLYDVALRLTGDAGLPPAPTPVEIQEEEPKVEEKMMAMMSTLAAMAPAPEVVVEPEPASVSVPEPLLKPEPILESEPLQAAELEQAPAEQPLMEELENNGNALLFDEIVIEPTPESETASASAPAQEKKGTQASLLDYLNQPAGRTLGETLAASHPLQQELEKKVDDLRTVININDKFSFMSELFKGNMKAYNDFIMHLNAIAQRDEALAHVHEVAAQYKWDEESAAVKAFYKVFDKKF